MGGMPQGVLRFVQKEARQSQESFSESPGSAGDAVVDVGLDTAAGRLPLHPQGVVAVGEPVTRGQRVGILVLDVDLIVGGTGIGILTPVTELLALTITVVKIVIVAVSVAVEIHIVGIGRSDRVAVVLHKRPISVQA